MRLDPSGSLNPELPVAPAIPGWGVDAEPDQRPGVPSHASPPRPVAVVPYRFPPPQSSEPTPLVGPLRSLTPVYSTAVPPRGLSGWLRRVAYGIPDHRARRWLFLLTADRIDAIEHGYRGRSLALAALGAAALAALTVGFARRT